MIMAQASSGPLQGLQRSAVSFRRQGSSGLVWDDRFLSGELGRSTSKTQPKFYSGELAHPNRAQPRRRDHDQVDFIDTAEVKVKPIKTVRSNDQRSRAHPPEPASEPPSPRLSGCGCCGALGKSPRSARNRTVRTVKSRTR